MKVMGATSSVSKKAEWASKLMSKKGTQTNATQKSLRLM
jgi:hypothetical protein